MEDGQASPGKSIVPRRKKKKRRLLKVFASLGLLSAALVVALPWLLGTPPGRDWVVGQVNARLAPGSIRLGGLDLGWNSPISLQGVALLDPNGKTVLSADRVTLDRGLLGLLSSSPDYGTVAIEGATVDLERRADGTIDLLDALASVLKSDAPTPAAAPSTTAPTLAPALSPTAVTVVLKGGPLRVVSPELVEPFSAKSLDGSLTIAPGKPIEVTAKLDDEGRSLEVRTSLGPDSPANLRLSLVGKDWPVHVRQSGVEAKARFDGSLEAKQDKGLWSIKGNTSLDGVEVAGPALLGDKLALDRVAAACDVEQSTAGWAIRKLDLTSPVATLQGGGTIPAAEGSPARIDAKVDLAALARALPNAMRLRDSLTLDRGTVTVGLDVTAAAGVDRFELVAGLDDFAAKEGGREVKLRQPAYLSGKASRSAGKVTVESLEVKAAGVDLTAGGDLEAGVRLIGTVDLAPLMAQVRDVLDLGGFDLSGRARVAADYRHIQDSFKGRFAVEFQGLKVVGATAEPIVRDQVRLDGWAIGASRLDGTPDGWHQARLDLKAGDLKLGLQADSTGATAVLAGAFEMPVTSPVPGKLEARATFRKAATAFEVDELIAAITPCDPKAASGAVALAVRGKFDPTTGEATFGPIPGQPIGAFGIAPEGAKVSGIGRSDVPLKVEASLIGELSALDALLATWNGTPSKGFWGLWSTQVSVTRSASGKLDLDGKVFVPDLRVSASSKGPVSLALKAGYSPDADRLDLPSLDLACRFGRLGLVGGMVETQGRRLFDLKGTFEPSWPAIDPIVVSSVEPNARVRATAGPLHLAGSLRGDSTPQILNQVFGEVGLDISEAKAFGLTLGQTPVVLRLGQGLARFDPIRSTLNDGAVSIVADLALDGDFGLWLRVGTSKVEGAEINEAVSNSILAYVAPVLAKSSEVSGKVTVAVDRAFVPITAAGPMSLDGAMALQNVIFKPGPLGDELTSLTGRATSDLRLDQAMFVKVHDGRVEQHGLSIPIGGNGLAVAIDGSVGFDETLDLKASIPVGGRGIGQPGAGPSVALPIQGTLAHPSIDRKALSVAIRNAAKALGEGRLKAEAGRFLDRIAGPAQPSKPTNRNPLGDLENLGREVIDPKKP